MRIRDLRSNADLDDVLEDTYYSTAWSATASTSSTPARMRPWRPYQIWRHRIGTPQAGDVLVWQEDDERFFLSVEAHPIRAVPGAQRRQLDDDRGAPSPPTNPWTSPASCGRRHEHEYGLDHWGDRFVILTNLDAEDFRAVTAPLEASATGASSSPTSRAAGSADRGVRRLPRAARVGPTRGNASGCSSRTASSLALQFADEVHAVDLGSNPEYETPVLRFGYESLVTPPTVRRGRRHRGALAAQADGVLEVDLSRYRSARTWAMADDGTQVPVDTVWHEDTPIDGTAPLVLYAHGSYEASIPPWFSIARLSLLDRGVVWALAIRAAVASSYGVGTWTANRSAAQHVHRRRCRRRAPRRRGVPPRPALSRFAVAVPVD